ncbi:MAG: hypothetical protein FJX64_06925 [Alphaproteobacteria bacterium]|nr:hypothetical protein [Alphaproteobacteria bacterium]
MNARVLVLVVLLVALGLSACGRKGDLIPPQPRAALAQ